MAPTPLAVRDNFLIYWTPKASVLVEPTYLAAFMNHLRPTAFKTLGKDTVLVHLCITTSGLDAPANSMHYSVPRIASSHDHALI